MQTGFTICGFETAGTVPSLAGGIGWYWPFPESGPGSAEGSTGLLNLSNEQFFALYWNASELWMHGSVTRQGDIGGDTTYTIDERLVFPTDRPTAEESRVFPSTLAYFETPFGYTHYATVDPRASPARRVGGLLDHFELSLLVALSTLVGPGYPVTTATTTSGTDVVTGITLTVLGVPAPNLNVLNPLGPPVTTVYTGSIAIDIRGYLAWPKTDGSPRFDTVTGARLVPFGE